MRLPLSLLTLAALILVGGCSGDMYSKYQLGAAKDTVVASIQDIGGLEAWSKVDKVYATAVVAYFRADGQADIDRLRLTMDYREGTITAVGMTPTGTWTATVTRAGDCKIQGNRPREVVCTELGLILHRSAGPLNFFFGGDRAGTTQRTRIEGVDVIRVPVTNAKPSMSYYFDGTTNMLRYVTSGTDVAGREGTLTIYGAKDSYFMLPNGLVFPRSIRVVKIGQNVLRSDTPVLDVDFSDVRIEEASVAHSLMHKL